MIKANAIYSEIICLGDSLTTGARDQYGRSYPMELEDILSEQTGHTFICHEEAVNGETSSQIRRRAAEAIARHPEAKELVLLAGTNDAKDWHATPPAIYRANITGILRIALINAIDVYLCTIPDLHGHTAQPYPRTAAQRITTYNQVIAALTETSARQAWKSPNESRPETAIRGTVELRRLPAECYRDGVHFSNRGNQEVAARIANVVLEARHNKAI